MKRIGNLLSHAYQDCDESQRAMAAAKMATLPPWRPKEGGQLAGLSQDEAAKLFNGDRSIRWRGRVGREAH
jgi:hypothetical protein